MLHASPAGRVMLAASATRSRVRRLRRAGVPHVRAGHLGRTPAIFGSVLAARARIAADTLGRVVASPSEVQAGIICAVIGAPFLVGLVRRMNVV